MMRINLDAREVYDYASRFFECFGRWPTLRETAFQFRCTYDELEGVVSRYNGDGYLGVAVADAVQGVGYAPFRPRGNQEIEAYGEEHGL